MRFRTFTLGGCQLVMMGHHTRSESLFYYFRLEDHVPEDHLLRLIDKHVDLGFVRDRLKHHYSDTGRPSIDPELLLRILLIGYLYGITSERRLVEEVRMHLAYRWFTGLEFDQEVPHHSTFSKNRHGRFQEANLFRELFEAIVARCVEVGLVTGKHLSVDGTQVLANAGVKSRVTREAFAEAAQVNRTVREYLEELAVQNPTTETLAGSEESRTENILAMLPEKLSKTDPDATWSGKNGPAVWAYYDNYLIDNESCIVIGVEATPARFSQEPAAAKQMITAAKTRFGLQPESLGADKGYGSAEFIDWLWNQGVVPHIPLIDRKNQTKNAFTRDDFTYLSDQNAYQCPEGKLLPYVGLNRPSQQYIYRSTEAQCGPCPAKSKCTSAPLKKIGVSWYEASRDRARALVDSPAFQHSLRARSKVEALFSELKQRIGLTRLKLRRKRLVAEQFLLAASAQNLKRMVRFLKISPLNPVAATA
jgi:transposase